MQLSVRNRAINVLDPGVKSHFGGQIPTGVLYINEGTVATQYGHLDPPLVGSALGIPLVLDTSLSSDQAKFVSSDGDVYGPTSF